ncbi:MAG: CPBP family intramembrane metalloprotease [Chloroflexota bacterium]|nr:CPBP family intramembrane metalloprotease [Chloroflexota bacterium]
MATAPRYDMPASAPQAVDARLWRAPALTEALPDGGRLLVTPTGPVTVAKTPLNLPRDTWRWLWKDTLTRVTPFLLAAWAWGHFSRRGAAGLGLRSDDLPGDTLLGLAVGLPLAAISAAFRRWVAPGYRLPTPADHAFQSAYYFLLNAPAEEIFWRGMLQRAAIGGLRRVPGVRRVAGLLGWAGTTAAFGAYHRLGGWSWRSIAGVTAAGGLFGVLAALPRRKSLLPAIIAHGFATAGFLNWGDAALHARRMRELRQPE